MNYFETKFVPQEETLDEAVRAEPSYIKILKLAVGIHFNSPKLSGDGDTQSSHIGYYFSTIRFKDWVYNYEPKEGRPTAYALMYTARTKNMISVGSTQKPDIREYTVVYAIDNVDFVKDMIKEEKSFQKYIETGVPNLDKMAEPLHTIAEECVRYAKVYWKNEDYDALTVYQTKLHEFGDILKNSPYGPGIKIRRATGGEPTGEGATETTTKIMTFVVPADKVKDYIKFRWQVNDSGGVDYEVQEGDKMVTKRAGEGSNTDIQTIKKPNGDLIVGVYGLKEFTDAFLMQCKNRGFLTNPGSISISGKTRSWDSVRKAMIDNFGADGTGAVKKPSGAAKPKATSKGISVTVAFDDDSFDRGAKLANAYVKQFNMGHRIQAEMEINAGNKSITLDNIDQETVDRMKTKFNDKGIVFDVM